MRFPDRDLSNINNFIAAYAQQGKQCAEVSELAQVWHWSDGIIAKVAEKRQNFDWWVSEKNCWQELGEDEEGDVDEL